MKKKKPNPELIDDENPEWMEEDFRTAKRIDEIMTPEQLERLGIHIRRRGPQKSPVKTRISIRLSADVVEQFRATGSGWQTRIDSALQDWLRKNEPADLA